MFTTLEINLKFEMSGLLTPFHITAESTIKQIMVFEC